MSRKVKAGSVDKQKRCRLSVDPGKCKLVNANRHTSSDLRVSTSKVRIVSSSLGYFSPRPLWWTLKTNPSTVFENGLSQEKKVARELSMTPKGYATNPAYRCVWRCRCRVCQISGQSKFLFVLFRETRSIIPRCGENEWSAATAPGRPDGWKPVQKNREERSLTRRLANFSGRVADRRLLPCLGPDCETRNDRPPAAIVIILQVMVPTTCCLPAPSPSGASTYGARYAFCCYCCLFIVRPR